MKPADGVFDHGMSASCCNDQRRRTQEFVNGVSGWIRGMTGSVEDLGADDGVRVTTRVTKTPDGENRWSGEVRPIFPSAMRPKAANPTRP